MNSVSVEPIAIDAERLWQDLMTLGDVTEPDRPYTRRAFSPLFADGRAFLRRRFEEAGLAVRCDAAGNMIGRLEGTEPSSGVIAVGSHSDTVPGGGRFDGIAGVIAALEVVRSLSERGTKLRHTIEVIDFLAEEPTDFGISCVGSRGLSGTLDARALDLRNPAGERLGDALLRIGGDPKRLSGVMRRDLRAFLELHIEQGPILEARDIQIGVVTSIVGIRRLELAFKGEPAHAGTAPMDIRRDAAVAAAETIVEVRRKAEELSVIKGSYFVATVGIVQVEPGGSNVVPGRARIVIDARTSDPALTDNFVDHLDRFSMDVATRFRVERSAFVTLSDGVPATCDERLRGALHRSAERLGYSATDIASGAGHDAAFLAKICPSAMVFIPCLRGMSHTPDEWADSDAIAAGTAVLLDAVRELDRTL